MKSIRSLKYLTTTVLFGLALAGTAAAKDQSAGKNSSQTKSGAVVTRTTRETGSDGRTSERIVVTEDNGDGTITRIVQVIHPDGTTETRGERRPVQQKS
jgi:hypothetical protein